MVAMLDYRIHYAVMAAEARLADAECRAASIRNRAQVGSTERIGRRPHSMARPRFVSAALH